MGVLADWQIEAEKIIEPFAANQKIAGKISSGVSSYGYDVRAGETFQVFSVVRAAGGVIDPKNFDVKFLEEVKGDCVIPPNAFALAYTRERISVPRSCIGIVLGKSTYARCGIVVNCTPLEPEWRGHVTMEISNTTPLPARVYATEGIAQVLFLRADGVTDALIRAVSALEAANANESKVPNGEPWLRDLISRRLCRVSYADKDGRYQDQKAAVALPCAQGQAVQHHGGD